MPPLTQGKRRHDWLFDSSNVACLAGSKGSRPHEVFPINSRKLPLTQDPSSLAGPDFRHLSPTAGTDFKHQLLPARKKPSLFLSQRAAVPVLSSPRGSEYNDTAFFSGCDTLLGGFFGQSHDVSAGPHPRNCTAALGGYPRTHPDFGWANHTGAGLLPAYPFIISILRFRRLVRDATHAFEAPAYLRMSEPTQEGIEPLRIPVTGPNTAVPPISPGLTHRSSRSLRKDDSDLLRFQPFLRRIAGLCDHHPSELSCLRPEIGRAHV